MIVMSSGHASMYNNRDTATSADSRYVNGYGNPGETTRSRSNTGSQSINGAPAQAIHTSSASPGMYVRALYNYSADDPTSLSFQEGALIQVLTQLESGWWDGIVNGQRGWFPSNYCVLVGDGDFAAHQGNDMQFGPEEDIDDTDGSYDEEYDDDTESVEGDKRASQQLPIEGTRAGDEASFWMPQSTPDGRLYYYNTLTQVAKMELPLENATSAVESGPSDRTTFTSTNQTRAPPELIGGAYDGSEEYDDEIEKRHSAVSQDSERSARSLRKQSQPNGHLAGRDKELPSIHSQPPLSINTNASSHATAAGRAANPALPDSVQIQHTIPDPVLTSFYDDGANLPKTWDELLEQTRITVAQYVAAVQDRDRSQYVPRAEDISDMLRLLIAAGSGTTDNHSGSLSIISSNKALHPHFRQFMAAFSKLVLSSHVASADWAPLDAESKCLTEADEVLAGARAFVEVARHQKGETLPRLKPGFVNNALTAANWSGNGLNDYQSREWMGAERQHLAHATLTLDAALVEKLVALRGTLMPSIRQLENTLEVTDNVAPWNQQQVIGSFVLSAAHQVVDAVKNYVQVLEGINLSPFGSSSRNPSFGDFFTIKQRLYDAFADLCMACQHVTAPLGDEWSRNMGESFEDRLRRVRQHAKEIDNAVQQSIFNVEMLVETETGKVMPTRREEFRRPSEPLVDSRRDTFQQGVPSRTIVRNRAGSTATNGPPTLTSGTSDQAVAAFTRPGNLSKAHRILGENIVPQAPTAAAPRMTDETPWFLGSDFEHEIQPDAKGAVKGGTLYGLAERLTKHDFLDSAFNTTFLLTYRSFSNASELFELLSQRFMIQPPPNLTTEEMTMWVERKQKPIRLRVFNIFKSWIETFWMEPKDEVSDALLRRIHTFAKETMAPAFAGAIVLVNLVEQRERGEDAQTRVLKLNLGTSAPAPVIPKNMKKLKFLDIDVLEFARQLTIIESRIYAKIKPTECLNKAWSAKPEEGLDPAENIKAMILHSNQLTNWVAEMILAQQEVKKRVVVIKHFISVAERCRQLNNFSAVTAIISAMSASGIHRLRRTWEQVPSRTVGILDGMKEMMGTTRNFSAYREVLHHVNPPCVPFLGVYLTDLTFIEDGNKNFLNKSNLINFSKRAKTAEVIREIQQYQSVPYPLQLVPELQDYILSNMQAAKNVNDMYDISLQIEPREREDEKIARLLQESGFL